MSKAIMYSISAIPGLDTQIVIYNRDLNLYKRLIMDGSREVNVDAFIEAFIIFKEEFEKECQAAQIETGS